jgi:S-methylmethionine-dependent homocysteine/selenocysteine methylase
MCTAHESIAAAQAAQEIAPNNWAISFCLSSTGEVGTLMDGKHISEVVPHLKGAQFIGINCYPATTLAH